MEHNNSSVTVRKAFNEEKRYNKEDYYAFIDGYLRDDINTKDFIEQAKYFYYNDKYFARVNNDEIFDDYRLEFYGKKSLNSHDLFSFINTYISNLNKIFIQEYKKIVLKDFRYNIFKITHLYLYNCVIDNNFINIINTYFKDLEYISIENSYIDDNAYLYKLNCNINIKNSTIKNSRSLKNIKSNLDYRDNKIIEYENIRIESSTAMLDLDDDNLKELLKNTTFSKLTHLSINSKNLNESLNYLSISCPNIVTLEINSIIHSFEFLYKMNNINKCTINSINDSIGTYNLSTPEITNINERKRITKSKKEEYQERLDILEYLNRLITAKKVMRFSQEEKEFYLGIRPSIEDSSLNHVYVYDLKNKSMNLDYDSNSYEKVIFNDRLYLISKSNFKSSGLIHKKKELLLSTPSIYYRDNIFLIFDRCESKEDIISSVEKEKEYIK